MATFAGRYSPFPEWGIGEAHTKQEEELAKLQAVSDALAPGEIVGAIISFPVADGQALYIVTKDRPLTVKLIDYCDGYEVSAATMRGLNRDDVLAQLAHRRRLGDYFKKADDWWEQQELGATLHYHNSFGQYIRGTVVTLEDGRKGLLPTALVGEWNEIDLVRRRPNGEIDKGYHVRQIEEGDAWRPSDSCMFESPKFGAHQKWKDLDPPSMPALDLTVPPMTEKEQEIAELYALREQVSDALEDPDPTSIRAQLVRAHEILSNELALV